MKKNRNKGWQKTAGAFALGATTGSAVALFLAPASGRATRKRLVSKFQSAGRSATRQIQQSSKLLAKKAESLKDAAVERIDDTREWLLEKVSNGNGRRRPMSRRVAHRS